MNESAVVLGLLVLTVSSLALAVLAGLLWLIKRDSPLFRSLATAIALTGCVGAWGGLTFLDSSRATLWHGLVWLGQAFQPAAILYVCIALMDPLRTEQIRATRWRARAMAAVGGLLAAAVIAMGVVGGSAGPSGTGLLDSPTAGRVVSSFLIMALVLDLAYLEQSLRLLRDPLRYRLKFILIGLGAVAGVQIYHASQLLGVPVEEAQAVLVSGFGSLLAMGLIAVGLLRTRLHEAQASIYVAPGVVYGSVTFVVIGLYLIAVGLVGEVIRYSGLPLGEVLSRLAMLAALLALLVAAVSRSARVRVNRWVARHFYHAKYDYRAKWLEVTDAFQECHTTEAVLDRFLDILSRTFGAPRISVWMHYESDGQFHLVRSTVSDGAVPPLAAGHPVVARLRGRDELLDLEVMGLRAGGPDDRFLACTQAELCVPIQSSGELLGFIALGRDERGERYHYDDYLLLRAIAHHVGMLLVLSRQTEERRAAVGLEALHRFSAFCLHDLKNLTAGLSLVVQNATVHGHDPAFQQSAMKTVSATVRKMTALMEKLSLKVRHETPWQAVDVGAMIRDTVASVKMPVCVDLGALEAPPVAVRAVREELQQVFLNLLLNARQAAGEQGQVSIHAGRDGQMIRVTVADNGPGIPPDRLRTLFQPFQTTKAGGLGIGLYQCKRILESHQGSIHIMSTVGQGTTIYVMLPVAGANPPGAGGTPASGQAGMFEGQEGACHAG